jgi:hypothetical protein
MRQSCCESRFALGYTKYPFAYLDDFRQAERQAREKRLGLWGPDPAPSKPSADELVYITKTVTRYHRAGCRALARSATAIRLAEVGTRYQPCGECHPTRLPRAVSMLRLVRGKVDRRGRWTRSGPIFD